MLNYQEYGHEDHLDEFIIVKALRDNPLDNQDVDPWTLLWMLAQDAKQQLTPMEYEFFCRFFILDQSLDYIKDNIGGDGLGISKWKAHRMSQDIPHKLAEVFAE